MCIRDRYGESISLNEEQKQRLLDNTERLERTGRQLDAGYQILLETEEIGSQVLRDLHSQRESIQKSRSRVSILSLIVESNNIQRLSWHVSYVMHWLFSHGLLLFLLDVLAVPTAAIFSSLD